MTIHRLLILCVALLIVSTQNRHSALAADQPNIIFLLTDDQRYDTLRCNGNSIIHTPNIDDLAATGVSFDRAYVTTSICAPNRACILTGQYAARHGMWAFDRELSPQQLQQTYPALLKRAGYRTGFIGKYGVGDPPGEEIFDYDRGFAGQGQFLVKRNGKTRHLTSIMGDQAIEFLQGCSPDQPFHLSISFKAPHVQDSPSVKATSTRMTLRPTSGTCTRTSPSPLACAACSKAACRMIGGRRFITSITSFRPGRE